MADEFKPKRDRLSGLSRRAKRRKMAMEEEKETGDRHALNAAIRLAKRANRPAKIGASEKHADKRRGDKNKASKRMTGNRTKSAFDSEIGWRKGK
jgi:ATP-dependent RNA helicase DDX27